ncbi:MAG: DUF4920 domain-containing protein [Pedobacter sp.]|jgi:hypothetical protein|nr:MAG: DUF4920 domain-containing protein [Pedobacter sp.]
MNKLLLSLVFTFMSAFAFAQTATPIKGQSFGEGVTEGGIITTAEIEKTLGEKNKADMKVTGVVTLVCQKKGCFMRLELPNKESMFVNFKDYEFFMPFDIAGKKVVIDGFAERKVTSVEDLKHYAEDAKKSAEEIAKITEPKKEIVFEAKGVVILD